MGAENKRKSTKNRKKEDGSFRSKNIKHDKGESARAVFGLNIENTDHDYKNGSI
ncbi:CPC_1213 family protein [Acetivibrio clariflavus]|uniref:CPC_1213 family protein n=1 Tax=Acetivibrio clariflavus TaxID=288965 RepID=UPI0004B6E8DB|nr:CPC_1213 family protein [Acetivibrio clariflavus]HOQ00472.1 CPC_1213 family protein [Acetivibrio clariflavus]HPU42500.1 CPC_1213 family protein [Acetivibrio clariflavus]